MIAFRLFNALTVLRFIDFIHKPILNSFSTEYFFFYPLFDNFVHYQFKVYNNGKQVFLPFLNLGQPNKCPKYCYSLYHWFGSVHISKKGVRIVFNIHRCKLYLIQNVVQMLHIISIGIRTKEFSTCYFRYEINLELIPKKIGMSRNFIAPIVSGYQSVLEKMIFFFFCIGKGHKEIF